LAIASVVLLCSAGLALGDDCGCNLVDTAVTPIVGVAPLTISGVPTAADLTACANKEINAFGFPDIDAGVAEITANAALDQGCDPCGLETPICGFCGECPDCSCTGSTMIFGGPDINLACPVLKTEPVPVLLKSPVISPTFPTINLAPTATVKVPQVTTDLTCFDISCCPLKKPIDPVW
jgi:hypothetical protein